MAAVINQGSTEDVDSPQEGSGTCLHLCLLRVSLARCAEPRWQHSYRHCDFAAVTAGCAIRRIVLSICRDTAPVETGSPGPDEQSSLAGATAEDGLPCCGS